MFLTGTDDSAIELVKTSKELDRIAGKILGVERRCVASVQICPTIRRKMMLPMPPEARRRHWAP